MPELNLDLYWFEHRKAVRLVGMLGKGADILPIKLWCYAGKHHPEDGRLTRYSVEEIESICGWTGEPGKLVAALTDPSINLLENGDGYFQVHDWLEHSGHLSSFKKRAKAASKARWSRYASSIPKEDIKHSLEDSSKQCLSLQHSSKQCLEHSYKDSSEHSSKESLKECPSNEVTYRNVTLVKNVSESTEAVLGAPPVTDIGLGERDPVAIVGAELWSKLEGMWLDKFTKRVSIYEREAIGLKLKQVRERGKDPKYFVRKTIEGGWKNIPDDMEAEAPGDEKIVTLDEIRARVRAANNGSTEPA